MQLSTSAQQLDLLAKTYAVSSAALIVDHHQDAQAVFSVARIKQSSCCTDLPAAWDADLRGSVDSGSSILQPLSIKTEHVSSAGKRTSPLKKFTPVLSTHADTNIGGTFSRANPITWTTTLPMSPGGQTLQVHVKREPMAMSGGCHIGDQQLVTGVLSSSHGVLPVVKLEQNSPTVKQHEAHAALTTTISSLNNGSIPVGIAVARQRAPHEMVAGAQSVPAPPVSQPQAHLQICKETRYDLDGAAMAMGVAPSLGGSLMHCDDRAANQIAAWPVGVPPPPTVAPPPALWQYPSPGQMAMESMLMGGMTGAVPPPGGFQIIRDPTTGALLLIPAPDQFQQAVVWGSYPPTSVLLPPPPPLAPLQLLGGADLLATASTTLHQHTQTHSTRLVALTADHKRNKPMQLPPHALIKIESEQTMLDACQATQCTKALQAVSSVTDTSLAPLLATHVFYQPSPNYLHLPPPPPHTQMEEDSLCGPLATVQDASNQTDAAGFDDDDTLGHTQNMDVLEDTKRSGEMSSEDTADFIIVPDNLEIRKETESIIVHRFESTKENDILDKSISFNNQLSTKISDLSQDSTGDDRIAVVNLQSEVINDNTSSSGSSHDLVIDSERVSPETIKENSKSSESVDTFKPLSKMDLSGLELLSSSIEQFETRSKSCIAKLPGLSMPSLTDSVCPPESEAAILKCDIADPSPFVVIKSSPKSPKEVCLTGERHFDFASKAYNRDVCEDGSSLGGLGLLCALAEQRFMEEVEDQKTPKLNRDIKREHEKVKKEFFSRDSDTTNSTKYKIKDRKLDNRDTDHHYPKHLSSVERESSSYLNSVKRDMRKKFGEKRKEVLELKSNRYDKLRLSLEEQPSRGDIHRKVIKRRLSTKSRSSSTSTVDNSELMESLDTSYRRIAQCNCRDNQDANHDCKSRTNWPTTEELVNAMELDMKKRLVELQRRYKEKQRRLNKLSPDTEKVSLAKRGPGRPRKKSLTSDRCNSSQSDRQRSSSTNSSCQENISCAMSEDSMKSLSCDLNLGTGKNVYKDLKDNHKRKLSPVTDSNSSQCSIDKEYSSSKKRKVGRPKKIFSTPGSKIGTETIVAKKPKSKSSLVGYLLAAKSRLNMSNNKGGIIYSKTNPPRPFETDSPPKKSSAKTKVRMKTTMTALESNCYSSPASSLSEYKYPSGYDIKQKYSSLLNAEGNSGSKVRPKLKAETKVKDYSEEDDVNNDWCNSQTNLGLAKSNSSSLESLHEVRMKNKEKTDRLAMKHKDTKLPKLIGDNQHFNTLYDSNENEQDFDKIKSRRKSLKPNEKSEDKRVDIEKKNDNVEVKTVCKLTEDHLNKEKTRVLTAMGGLFYAGQLKAIEAPDVYAITLDGERGNRPHILSREEILRDAILEVCPTSTKDLLPGTRLCAYWSQQYRCLYPGTVAEPSTPDPTTDDKFVPVEFDDGDSGKISIEDIRLLQPDYPIVEYDPNPLLTLGKRRRQTSVNSMEDKKTNPPTEQAPSNPQPSAMGDCTTHTTDKSHSDEESYKERKKLKKHRKDKTRHHLSRSADENSNADGDSSIRKKKKKHKCCDEFCKHRKHHKKHHRKHRKHHRSSSKEHSSSSGEDNHPGKILINFNSSVMVECADQESSTLDSNASIAEKPENSSSKVTIPKIKKVIKKSFLNNKLTVDKSMDNEPGKKIKKIIVKGKKIKKDNFKDSGISLDADDNSITCGIIIKKDKAKKRTVSTTSSESTSGNQASKMAAFLPGTQLWGWHGQCHKKTALKGRMKKSFYKAIQRGNEVINVGDSAVFLSTGRPDRPYIGQVSALWSGRQDCMAVRVKWYYHPEETIGCPGNLQYPGGLFESPHTDENDVQTISHKCEVLPFSQYRDKFGEDHLKYASVYDNNDTYYLAGHYEPTQQVLKMENDIPFDVDSTE